MYHALEYARTDARAAGWVRRNAGYLVGDDVSILLAYRHVPRLLRRARELVRNPYAGPLDRKAAGLVIKHLLKYYDHLHNTVKSWHYARFQFIQDLAVGCYLGLYGEVMNYGQM